MRTGLRPASLDTRRPIDIEESLPRLESENGACFSNLHGNDNPIAEVSAVADVSGICSSPHCDHGARMPEILPLPSRLLATDFNMLETPERGPQSTMPMR